MKIIALEEAFSVKGLGLSDEEIGTPIPIDPAVMADWGRRLPDFSEWRISDMDTHGVSIQVLSLTTPGIQGAPDAASAVANAKIANNHLAAVTAKFPERFKGFAALPMQDPGAAVQELRRCITELGFCGALINDHTNGHYMDEAQFEPVWAELEDLDVPLYIHPGAPSVDKWNVLNGRPELTGPTWSWGPEAGGHALRLVYGGVFDRHPKAKIILGHMGEFLPFQVWRLDSRYGTLKEKRLDLTPSQYFGRNIFITTSGMFSPAALAGAVAEIGEDAVMFSIDYPYESTELAVKFLKSAPLSQTAREKIAWRNAERILRIG